MPKPQRFDFSVRPFVMVWEMTQACDLVCIHCRAEAQPNRHEAELTPEEARGLIDQVADLDPGVMVLSGGDPLKRDDVYEVIRYGTSRGIRMTMTPSVTPLLTDEAIGKITEAGLSRMAVSLDGSCAQIHDSFRGVDGSFERTLQVYRRARHVGLPLQINTTITRHNYDDVPSLARLLYNMDIVLWSVFFLVPVGRAEAEQRIAPEQYERVFEILWEHAQRVDYLVKSTEAPHYRRFVLEKLKEERASRERRRRAMAPTQGVNDGRGFVFVSHVGEVFPSGFLAVPVGNIRETPLAKLYRTAPLMQQLRDADQLGGKCGVCTFRNICGGSRARAWALTGDPLASEPDCLYMPEAMPHTVTP